MPNPSNLPEVNHKDENTDNNCIENLEWCDKDYNCRFGTRNERIKRNQPHARKVLCIELNQEFESISEAAKQLNLNRSNIISCLNGRLHTSGGYHWQYV